MGVRESATSVPGPKTRSPQTWMGMLDHVVLLASVGTGLSLVYLLFVILSGTLAAPLIAGSALEQVTRNVEVAKGIFLWSLWLVMVAAMVRHHRSDLMSYLALLAGVGCWAILPLVVRSRVPETSAYPLMELAHSLVSSFRISGGALMVLGFLRVVLRRVLLLASSTQAGGACVLRLQASGVEAPPARTYERPSLLARCWELHFCRESLRRHCPRFLEGASCWKKRSGCYCDQDLATRLLSGIGSQARLQVEEEMRVIRSPAWEYEEARRRKRQQAKKTSCGNCPLYLEHQKYKYRTLSWLSYPIAAAIIGLSADHIRAGYEWVDLRLGSVLAQFQVLPHPFTDRPLEAAPWLNAQNAVVFIVGVLVVGLILQLTEVVVFRFKW